MASIAIDQVVKGNVVKHDHSESDLGAVLDTRYLKLDCSNNPLTQPLQITVSNDNSGLFLETYDNESEQYSRLRLRKSDHISVLSETDNADWLGIIQFEGCNTTPDFAAGARIYARQNGASGAYVPADLYLDASTDDAAYTELKISAVDDNFVFSNIADNTITLTPGSITDSTGAISFGDENLSTTGTITGHGLISTNNIEIADGGYIGSTSANNALSISAVGDATFIGQVLADNFSDGTLTIVNGDLSTTGTITCGTITQSGTTLDNTYVNITGDTMTGNLIVNKDQDAMTEIRIDNDTEGTGEVTHGFTMYDGATKVASIERTNNGAETVINNTGGLLQIKTTTSGDILLAPAGVVYLNDDKKLAFGGQADTDSYIMWDNSNSELDIYSSGEINFGSSNLNTTGTITGTTIAGANTNWDAAYSHISSSGADHTYIDQDVTTTGTPTFAATLFTDKIKLTQTDGNEYIDSLADGYLDLAATTSIRLRGTADTSDPKLEFVSGNSGYIEWQEDEQQFYFNGGVEISGAWWMTAGAGFFPRQVNDNAMDATDGTEGEIVYNQDDNKFWGCTVTGTPATWAAFN